MIVPLIIAFLGLVALMIIHEFGHFIIAKKFGVRVEEFGIGYPPRIFGKKFGETLYSVNLVPLGAFVKIFGEEESIHDPRSFSSLSVSKRILVCLGGVIAFWIASAIIFGVVFGIGAYIPVGDQDVSGISKTAVKVFSVERGTPAETAGIKEGDEIISIEKGNVITPINKIADFQAFMQANKGNEIKINILRKGENISFMVMPRMIYSEGEGPLGVSIDRVATVIEKKPWYEAPVHGIIYTGKITWQALAGIYNVFASLIGGKGVPQGAELAGPVGITIFLSKAANFGAGFFLYFIGSLSVVLAIFNLFPIPALDGGKLVFLIIEGIKRRPVSPKIEQNLTVIFFVLLIAMSIFITVKFDFPRIVELWKIGI